MKVLQKGNPNGWEIERDCTGQGNGDGGCGAKLLVAEDDIFVTSHSVIGEVDYYYTFECPECGCKTDIPEKEIPKRVCDKAMKKYKSRKHL